MNTATRPARSRPQREIDIARYVREKPMTALAIASAAGFILNGGVSSRLGRTVVGIVGPILIRSAVTSAIVGLVTSGGNANGSHDDGRK